MEDILWAQPLRQCSTDIAITLEFIRRSMTGFLAAPGRTVTDSLHVSSHCRGIAVSHGLLVLSNKSGANAWGPGALRMGGFDSRSPRRTPGRTSGWFAFAGLWRNGGAGARRKRPDFVARRWSLGAGFARISLFVSRISEYGRLEAGDWSREA